jgi:dGTPase
VAAIADDIAYDTHDTDDGLRAELFALDDVAEVSLFGTVLGEIRARYPGLETPRLVHELIRRAITRMIEDAIAESAARLAKLAPRSAEEVRAAGAPVIGFSPAMEAADAAIKGFLYPRMYRHPRIARIMNDAEAVVHDLFSKFAREPDAMPPEWAHGLEAADEGGQARRIADFIAGMTDRYALVEHARYFDSTPELS